MNESIYPLGVTFASGEDGRTFLIASAEKALLDMFTLNFKSSDGPRYEDIDEVLRDDLRIDLVQLKALLRKSVIDEMKPHYRHRIWCKLLLDFLSEEL